MKARPSSRPRQKLCARRRHSVAQHLSRLLFRDPVPFGQLAHAHSATPGILDHRPRRDLCRYYGCRGRLGLSSQSGLASGADEKASRIINLIPRQRHEPRFERVSSRIDIPRNPQRDRMQPRRMTVVVARFARTPGYPPWPLTRRLRTSCRGAAGSGTAALRLCTAYHLHP